MEEAGTEFQPHVRRKPKMVTLQPGSWIFICPCGFPYQVMRLRHANSKVGTYCFSCRNENGKYYRVMEERLDFPYNPNGILNCTCFAMLRLHNPIKNCVGALKQIYLKDVWKGTAKVINIDRLCLADITPAMSYLSAGLPPEELRKKLKGQCRNRPGINWDTQLLDFMVLEYQKESREPVLFK